MGAAAAPSPPAAAGNRTVNVLCRRPRRALLVAQLSLLSLDLPLDLHYPWDCLLYESGWLALLLPAPTLGTLALPALPGPLLAWGFRWLLFRLMLGFGKLKFYEKRPVITNKSPSVQYESP